MQEFYAIKFTFISILRYMYYLCYYVFEGQAQHALGLYMSDNIGCFVIKN